MNTEEYFDKIRDLIIGKKIKGTKTVETTARDGFGYSINGDALVLEDGTILNLYMSEFDCCASAYGEWDIPNLEAGITDVQFHVSQDREPDVYDDGAHYSRATITILHNQNSVTTADCYANDGNAGYYFSVLNLEVKLPTGEVIDEAILSA
jgi:hypothetical protein